MLGPSLGSDRGRNVVCQTNYRTLHGSSDLLSSVMMWEVGRATLAATSIFDPIAVGRVGEDFVDGATGANSAMWEA
jgi:hypothetical protein